ncbi:MAG: helix-turn-helix transcriptional regulator [Fulvivirga sp.]
MKGTYLGEFEELVLLTVAVIQQDGAYGNPVMLEIENRAKRNVSLSAVHAALHRLEKKGFVESYKGEATAKRGGKSKRLYKISAYGLKALNEAKDLREGMWSAIPNVVLDKGSL